MCPTARRHAAGAGRRLLQSTESVVWPWSEIDGQRDCGPAHRLALRGTAHQQHHEHMDVTAVAFSEKTLVSVLEKQKQRRTKRKSPAPPFCSWSLFSCFFFVYRKCVVANSDNVMEEQRRIVERFGEALTYESVANMPVLQDSMKEALRMYPPLIFLMRKVKVAKVSCVCLCLSSIVVVVIVPPSPLTKLVCAFGGGLAESGKAAHSQRSYDLRFSRRYHAVGVAV